MDDLDNVLAKYGSVAEYNRVQNEEEPISSYDYADNQDYLDTDPEFVWNIIPECNDDNNRPSCYSIDYMGQTFWASHLENGWAIEMKCSDGEYRPINSDYEGFLTFSQAAEYFEDTAADLFDDSPFLFPNEGNSRK